MAIDNETLLFINQINTKKVKLESLNRLYKIYHQYDNEIVTFDIIRLIILSIDKEFYEGNLLKFLEINIHEIDMEILNNDIKTAESFISLEFNKNNRFKLNIEMQILNSLHLFDGFIYYSGGYLTHSKIVFIILMLLHETIHMIEFKDSWLSIGAHDHSVFFYKHANLWFGFISRLSEIIKITDQKELIKYNIRNHLRIFEEKILNKNIKFSRFDAVNLLNDHSMYTDFEGNKTNLGYFVKDSFMT
ncbi:hypothetical protein CPAV1605_1533 [seawater metagenome]|uniref:Uncharacterized protein n=1 Tax=seawater metagenome TaxID=1561972 RepID=A0A5E8CKX0_9ZZZZ